MLLFNLYLRNMFSCWEGCPPYVLYHANICLIFFIANKSHISYLLRYSKIAIFVPLKAAEAKLFGHGVEDKEFLLQKPSISSHNTNASTAAQAMMLSQQSWQLSSMHWSPSRWWTFEQHLQKEDAPNLLSSHSRLQAHPGARSQHWGWVGPVSTQTCEHRSTAKRIRGEREWRAVYKHRVPWRTLLSPGCPHPRSENTAGKLCFGNRGIMNENLCWWESKGKKPTQNHLSKIFLQITINFFPIPPLPLASFSRDLLL